MTIPYPEIDVFSEGMLDVGDANSIYWTQAGNPKGVPVLLLHGGPGSGSSTSARRFYDPDHYSIIQFDQRGCGKSVPHASEPDADFAVNTTWHLVADIERLRSHLGIERWLVYGNSWGCTLALIYAQRHPERVMAMVLVGVTMTRKSEIDWLYHGMGRLFPEEWHRFRLGVPVSERDGDLVAAYYRLLQQPDPAIHAKAAADWHDWEAASILADGRSTLPRQWSNSSYRIARARIITHYFHHRAWLDERQVLRDIPLISEIPSVLIQGRLDLEAPLTTAWELSQAWPNAKLVVLSNSAHSATTSEMVSAIIEATDNFRGLR